MIASQAFRFAAWVLCLAVLAAGCSRPAPPKPDGSSGVRGRCLLPAADVAKDGNAAERKRWAGVEVTAHQMNSPYADYDNSYRATADANGEFRLALNPGEYTIGVYDPKLLKNKMLSPISVKVEAGQFTEVVIDYDKLNVRDLPKQ